LAAKFIQFGEGRTMVATHPGMSDQTNSNIARDGAAKKTQTKFPVKDGMKNMTTAMTGVSPENPGVGPDADPANPLSPEPKSKHQYAVKTSWGMNGSHDASIGSAVLNEASNLGR
jgi:hypothetical protein